LFSTCATALAGAGWPSTASAASYRSLYQGLDKSDLVQPPLLAETSLAVLQADFPTTSPTRPRRELRGLGPQLYLGLTLARLKPPPRSACFELIGPVMYQVLALPLKQFPRHRSLSIVVKRPSGSPGDQVSVRLP
jgi:hypothetical protein